MSLTNKMPQLAITALLAWILTTPVDAGQRPPSPAPPGAPVKTSSPLPAPRTSAPTSTAAAPAGDKSAGTLSSVRDYRLGSGDKLRIDVYRDTQLSGPVQVRPDGKITMPLIGDIQASGRTPIELRDAITLALKEYVNNPAVTVAVVEATAATAYIYGEVNRPGPVMLNGDVTVLQALSMAGGPTAWAKLKSIRIQRSGPAGVQTVPFNYRDAIDGFGVPVYLRPGDTVIVPD